VALTACAGVAAGKAPDAAAPGLEAAIGRVLPAGTDPEAVHRLKSQWNGQPVVFVDYPVQQKVQGEAETDVMLKAFIPSAGGYKAVDIGMFEEEGGTAEVRAVAFANADRDKARELVVLVAWPVQHYDVEGTYYQVRIYDDLGAGAHPLTALNTHFGEGCDCNRRDDKPDRFRYKTIAAIRKELVRMGY
jgi:hypothetical protein